MDISCQSGLAGFLDSPKVKPPVYSNSNHAVLPIRERGAFSDDNHWRSKMSREQGGRFKATRHKILRGREVSITEALT